MSETDIDDVLDLIGFGYVQVLMVFTCAMITIYVNNELMGIGLVSLAISCELSTSNEELSLLSIAAFVGLILSSLYAGYKTDRIGRRTMVIISLMLSLLSSIISALMPSFYTLLFWRFMTGFFISGAGVNNLTYLTEYTKIALRPRMVNFMSYSVALFSMYMPALATLMRPLNRVLWNFGSYKVCIWRFSLLAHCLPGAVAFCGMWLLPETAKFLLSVGDHDGAYDALNRLCLIKHKQDLKSFGVTSITQQHNAERHEESMTIISCIWKDIRKILGRSYVRSILQVIVILSGFLAVSNGFGWWFSKIRNYSTEDSVLCESLEYCYSRNETTNNYHCKKKAIIYTDGIILGFSTFCCCIFAAVLLLFLSRRLVLTFNAVAASIFGISLNFVKQKISQLIAEVLFIAMCSSSVSLAGSVTMDIVPTPLRGTAAALTYMCGRLAVVATSLLFAQMMCNYCAIYLNLIANNLLLVAAMSFFLPV